MRQCLNALIFSSIRNIHSLVSFNQKTKIKRNFMKYLPYIYLLIVITTACEQVVEIDIPEHEPQLVLSSLTRLNIYLE